MKQLFKLKLKKEQLLQEIDKYEAEMKKFKEKKEGDE